MAVKAFSAEWAEAFKDEVNKSPVYKAAGKGWKWTVGLVVEAEPDKHFAEARGIVMDLFEGEARDVTVGSAADAQKCDFVITAPYSRWKQVATKELDATKGMLQGKLKPEGRSAHHRALHEGFAGDDGVHDKDPGRVARRKLGATPIQPAQVDYADEEPSAFASMLGGLIQANVESRPEKQQDFATLVARVGMLGDGHRRGRDA